MKSLKNHMSFLIPLFALLFSIQFSTMLSRSIINYETKLAGEYTIVVVSSSIIDREAIAQVVPSIDTITEVKKDKYIDRLKDNMSQSDIVYLRATLPKFYSIKLKHLPTEDKLSEIAQSLKEYPKVQKVETFKATFNKLHQFLKLAKSASIIFTIFISIISFLLIMKQMEIWTLQHKKRMYIMGLFGAPYWMKSASLYKSVVLDAIIAAIGVGFIFLNIQSFVDLTSIKDDLGIDLSNFHFFIDTFKLTIISLTLSIISVTITLIRQDNS